MSKSSRHGRSSRWLRSHGTGSARLKASLAVVLLAAATLVAAAPAASASPTASASTSGGVHGARVLRVGTWHGIPGTFTSVQAAVNAARPGDWILVAPGDYHEQGDHQRPPSGDATGAVMITTPDIHLRGMDRNKVVIDGTKPGAPQCSTAVGDQDFGPTDTSGRPAGRNGVEVYKANGVTVDNLTACNFLDGDAGGGNAIWWNGGDGSGTTNLGSFWGSYLSATTTFFADGMGSAQYGIFVSNTTGPGTVAHSYASNMADSGYYVGACPDCNTVLSGAHAENNALGYSGTNSGGHLQIRFSEFDRNKTGISTNSQNNDDQPSPQEGACPNGGQGPFHTGSCTVFWGNVIHDNNNPNVPGSGTAELGPPGTGIVISGGRNDTVAYNLFANNGSWAVLVVPFIDTGTPPPIAHCTGGVENFLQPGWCYFAAWGNETAHNLFVHNGGFGNPTNGDLADLSDPHDPGNCWHDNFDVSGAVTSAPTNLEATNGVCGQPGQGEAVLGSELSNQVICATEIFGPCPPQPGMSYPRKTATELMPLPPQQTMPDPCAGVPNNPWCRPGFGPPRWSPSAGAGQGAAAGSQALAAPDRQPQSAAVSTG